MTEAAAFFAVIFENLNNPPAADAIKAPIITPKFKIVVVSANIEVCNASVFPCQYPQLATSKPIASAAFEPQSVKAEVTPQGVPRINKVNAFSMARTIAAANKGHEPRRIRFHPISEGTGAISGL